jgi:hypothetical protein
MAIHAGLPSDSGYLSLDEDGTPCSSRLTRDGGHRLKGTLALTQVRPTAPL